MHILAGTSHPQLAQKLASATNLDLLDRDISKFANLELRVHLLEQDSKLILLQTFSDPVNSHIIETLLLADAAKRNGTKQITALIPYLGYSKQDKVFRSGEPLSVKVISSLLEAVGFDQLITLDLHNPKIADYFTIPVHNLSAQDLFIDYAGSIIQDSDAIVVSPDAGSVQGSDQLAKKLSLNVAHMQKMRSRETGEVTVKGIDRDISGKTILMFDDLIATGQTLIRTSQFLHDHGAKDIYVFATHHQYLPGVQTSIDHSHITQLCVTDTIPKPKTEESQKLHILSVAPLLAEKIKTLK